MLISGSYREMSFSRLLMALNIVFDRSFIADIDKINQLQVSFFDMSSIYRGKDFSKVIGYDGDRYKPSKLRVLISSLYNCVGFEDCLIKPHTRNEFNDLDFIRNIEDDVYRIVNSCQTSEIFYKYMSSNKWGSSIGSVLGAYLNANSSKPIKVLQNEISQIRKAWIDFSLATHSFTTNFNFKSDDDKELSHDDLDRYLMNCYNTMFVKDRNGKRIVYSIINERGSSINTSETDGDVSAYDNMSVTVNTQKYAKNLNFSKVAQAIFSASYLLYRNNGECFLSIYDKLILDELRKKIDDINSVETLKAFAISLKLNVMYNEGIYEKGILSAKEASFNILKTNYFDQDNKVSSINKDFYDLVNIYDYKNNTDGKKIFGTNNIKGSKLENPNYSIYLKLVYGFSALRALKEYCDETGIDFYSIDGSVFRDYKKCMRVTSLEEYMCKSNLKIEEPKDNVPKIDGLMSTDDMLGYLYTGKNDNVDILRSMAYRELEPLEHVLKLDKVKKKENGEPYLEYVLDNIKYSDIVENNLIPSDKLYNFSNNLKNKIFYLCGIIGEEINSIYDITFEDLLKRSFSCLNSSYRAISIDNCFFKCFNASCDKEVDKLLRFDDSTYTLAECVKIYESFKTILDPMYYKFLELYDGVVSEGYGTNGVLKNLLGYAKINNIDFSEFITCLKEVNNYSKFGCLVPELNSSIDDCKRFFDEYKEYCDSLLNVKDYICNSSYDIDTNIIDCVKLYNEKDKVIINDLISLNNNSVFIKYFSVCLSCKIGKCSMLEILRVCDCCCFISDKVRSFCWGLLKLYSPEIPLVICKNSNVHIDFSSNDINPDYVEKYDLAVNVSKVPVNISSVDSVFNDCYQEQGIKSDVHNRILTLNKKLHDFLVKYFNTKINSLQLIDKHRDYNRIRRLLIGINPNDFSSNTSDFCDLEFYHINFGVEIYSDYSDIFNKCLNSFDFCISLINTMDTIFDNTSNIMRKHFLVYDKCEDCRSKYEKAAESYFITNRNSLYSVNSTNFRSEFSGFTINELGFYKESVDSDELFSITRTTEQGSMKYFYHSGGYIIRINSDNVNDIGSVSFIPR